ncbi:MAG: DUF3267 domain-containing protein [Bilifractor sp.]|jgi:mannose/fructose/N-acetylgalactosamine-specific phosphotransferase system component IID
MTPLERNDRKMSVIKKNWLLLFFLLLLAVFVIYKLCVLDIVWEVHESEADVWRESSVPSNAVKVIQTSSQAELLRQSFFMTVPLLIGFCVYLFIGKKKHRLEVSRAGFVIGAVISFLLQPFHELLHGLAFPRGSTVYIGFIRDNFSAYAYSSNCMNLAQCIVYHLLPAVVLGIVPLLLFIACRPKKGRMCWALYGFAMVGLIQTDPDWFGLFPILTQVPSEALIQMSGWDTYWFIP